MRPPGLLLICQFWNVFILLEHLYYFIIFVKTDLLLGHLPRLGSDEHALVQELLVRVDSLVHVVDLWRLLRVDAGMILATAGAVALEVGDMDHFRVVVPLILLTKLPSLFGSHARLSPILNWVIQLARLERDFCILALHVCLGPRHLFIIVDYLIHL